LKTVRSASKTQTVMMGVTFPYGRESRCDFVKNRRGDPNLKMRGQERGIQGRGLIVKYSVGGAEVEKKKSRALGVKNWELT